MGVENVAPTRSQSPDHPVCSESLYQPSYPGPPRTHYMKFLFLSDIACWNVYKKCVQTVPVCNVAPHNIVSLYHRQILLTKDTMNIAYPQINAGFSIAGLIGSVICLAEHTVLLYSRLHCVMPASSFEMHFISITNIATAQVDINPLKPELNLICYLLALLAHHFLHVSRIRVKSLTFRLLMSYIYGAPILDVSRSHTTKQHSR